MTGAETTLTICSCWRRGSLDTSSKTLRSLPGGLLLRWAVTRPPFALSRSTIPRPRLTYAKTASLVRGGGYEQTGPYQEGFGYDARGNLTLTGGFAWSTEIPNISATYVNNRNTAWTYDAEGNGTQEGDMTWAYDAAGQSVYLRRPRTPGSSFVTTKDRFYDGDGAYVKEVIDGVYPS